MAHRGNAKHNCGTFCEWRLPQKLHENYSSYLALLSISMGQGLQTLQWRHIECDGVSNHRQLECLHNRLFWRRSKKISKLRVTGLCEGNSPVTGEFPAQIASNVENVSIWWRHHGTSPLYQIKLMHRMFEPYVLILVSRCWYWMIDYQSTRCLYVYIFQDHWLLCETI